MTTPSEGRSGLALRDLDVEDVAAELLDDELVLQQLLADAVGVGVGLVHLVDGDDDRHLRRLGVADRLDRLLLDAVIAGDDEDDDVGDVGAARAHRGEGLVARRVDEGDALAALQLDLIGADMLGDAAGLAGRDVGVAQRVEQRRLAVIDMAHDGDDRRARLEIVLDIDLALEADLDIGLGDALQLVAELGDDQFGGVGIDHLVDRRHDVHAHQRFDDVGAALGHAVGEFLHGDRLGDDDVAHDLGRFGGDLLLAQLFAGAAHRGEAAHALVGIAVERAGHRHLAAAARLLAAHQRRRLLDLRTQAALDRRLFLGLLLADGLDLAGGGQGRDLGGSGLAGTLGHLAA